VKRLRTARRARTPMRGGAVREGLVRSNMNRFLMLLPVTLVACGPSVTTLVAEKRWDESVCAVSNQREAELAIPAIVEASHARFVVHEIGRADLITPLDDATLGDFFTRYAVYVVDTRADPTSTTTQTITGSIAYGKKVSAVEDFTSFTAEKMPEGHSEKQSQMTMAAPSKVLFAVLSGGLSLLVDDRPMTQVVDVWVPPTPEQIEAKAPRASKIAASFALTRSSMAHYVVPRSEPASVQIVVDAKSDKTCTGRAMYHARMDTLKIDEWKNVSDVKWTSIHTSADGNVVNVDR
jgi:hypothetical protein